MRTHLHNQVRRQSALTLVEMMVATSLLVVMMLGLTAMFNQTQRAFRSGLKQVDVFEGGRAVADLMTRDFESLSDMATLGKISFYYGDHSYGGYSELIQPNGSLLRTNRVQYIFGQSRIGSDWIATGYCFKPSEAIGVMTLYRFTAQTNTPNNSLDVSYRTAIKSMLSTGVAGTNLHRVADGIISLKVRAFNKEGLEIAPGTNYLTFPITNFVGGVYQTNRLPAQLEIELGILEPQTLEQAKSVADPKAYLERQIGKVHIFRQQIPIRNASR